MAKVTMNGKVYTGVRFMSFNNSETGDINVHIGYYSKNKDIENVFIKVPHYLRVEVAGNLNYLRGDRVEVYGDVKRGACVAARCEGSIGVCCTSASSAPNVTFGKAESKVITLADEAKANGKSLGRATVVRIEGNMASLWVGNSWEYRQIPNEVVVNGHVGEAKCTGVLCIKGNVNNLIALRYLHASTNQSSSCKVVSEDAIRKMDDNRVMVFNKVR